MSFWNPSTASRWHLKSISTTSTVYGVGRLLLPFPSPKRLWLGVRLLTGAAGIIFPIMKAEGLRQMFFPATVPAYYRSLQVDGQR